jgi:hypothetical protein
MLHHYIELNSPFFDNCGRFESNMEGASVANFGGKSSMPGKSVFKKCPSNEYRKSVRLMTSSL